MLAFDEEKFLANELLESKAEEESKPSKISAFFQKAIPDAQDDEPIPNVNTQIVEPSEELLLKSPELEEQSFANEDQLPDTLLDSQRYDQ